VSDDKVKFGAMHRTANPLQPAEFARRAEDLGFDSVWVAETTNNREPNYDVSAALAAAATVTSHVKLGTSVQMAPLHHPAWLARQWSTLDILSGGRTIVGLGVGGEWPVQFELFNIPLTERGKRTDEVIQVMKKLWTEPVANFDGQFYKLDGIIQEPRPVQRPHPPIWVGGRPGGKENRTLRRGGRIDRDDMEQDPTTNWHYKSKKGAVRRAATLADGWMPFYMTPEMYRDSIVQIQEHAAEIGRDISHMEWALTSHWLIRDSFEEALDQRSKMIWYGRDLGRKWGDYEILGDPKTIIPRLEQYVEAGVRHFICGWRCEMDEIPRHIEIIADEVIPYFK
jgi:alkanesulfonate monooxygenase SsuD/methylene tetrahydromethanopterin reductase-like flavin-dependent oxidoreductase (luciferase family)